MRRRTDSRKAGRKRSRSVLIILLVILGIGGGALWLYSNPEVFDKVKGLLGENVSTEVEEQPVRGSIFDRNYKGLAVSLERVGVYVRTRELGSLEFVAEKLAPVLEMEEGHLLNSLKEGGLRIWLMKDISQEQEDNIRVLNLPGVYLHKDFSRFYPQKTVAAHLIGFADNGIGLAGVEYYYDRLVQEVLSDDTEGNYRGRGGQHLLLTIDLKIQRIIEELVFELSKGRPRSRIGIYAMNAKSGSIVAASQFPSFNPNTYRIYSQDILDNLLLTPMVVPKMYRQIFHDGASIKSQYDNRGNVLPWSVSKGSHNLGTELRMWDSLGFDARPSDEFGASQGAISGGQGARLIDRWSESMFGTVPQMLTPLNVLSGMSSLINGGNRIKGHIVNSIVDPVTEHEFKVNSTPAAAGAEVVSTEVSREVSQLVSSFATANDLGGAMIEDEAIGIFQAGDKWTLSRNNVLFAAVPLRDAELTILMTIQEDGVRISPGTGGSRTLPAEMLSLVLPRIAVLEQVGRGLQQVAEPEQKESGNFPASLDSIRDALQTSMVSGSRQLSKPGVMPDMVGLSLRKSLRLLQEANCTIRIYGTGHVVSQEPKPGTRLKSGDECVLKLRQEDVSVELYEKNTLKQ